ncbi:MAG: NADH:ubiquinone reductase (Na(+)-transporting) subunit A, partial [Candidatus Marinimicrobia bacterium]|nr:NADH:ubiquinone reductase (Na(+)-transporting) subunit A [Candidatus Neomarinimicrobiota bacterium]
KAIFISLMNTAPLAADQEYLLKDKMADFNSGLKLLQKFTDGKIHVTINEGSTLKSELKNCEIHEFSGPHPAGNVGIHIHHIDPIKRGEIVWTIKAAGLLSWFTFFKTGKYPSRKLVAVAGSGVDDRKYFNVVEGTMIKDFPGINTNGPEMRYISGDVLTGNKRDAEEFIGLNDSLLTVIPEGRHRNFLGWAAPGFKAFSFSKTFFSSLFPKKEYELDTNNNGGPRAFVQTGIFEQVIPMDLYPDYLLRSILAEDIAEMEGLGIYEVSEEDFALCSYIDPSKNDVCGIIRHGLELIEKEG